MNNYKTLNHTYIPPEGELKDIVENSYPTGRRKAIQNGTNCSGEMINYVRKGKNVKLFAKKSFIKGSCEQYEEEYKLIKSRLKNIIPNQGFVPCGNDIFVFCSPIGIKIDILLEENKDYLIEVLKKNNKLQKQLRFFIREFEKLLSEGNMLDLYGTENLVISEEDKLYYIDSFLVFNESKIIQEGSIRNIEYLKRVIKELD